MEANRVKANRVKANRSRQEPWLNSAFDSIECEQNWEWSTHTYPKDCAWYENLCKDIHGWWLH